MTKPKIMAIAEYGSEDYSITLYEYDYWDTRIGKIVLGIHPYRRPCVTVDVYFDDKKVHHEAEIELIKIDPSLTVNDNIAKQVRTIIGDACDKAGIKIMEERDRPSLPDRMQAHLTRMMTRTNTSDISPYTYRFGVGGDSY